MLELLENICKFKIKSKQLFLSFWLCDILVHSSYRRLLFCLFCILFPFPFALFVTRGPPGGAKDERFFFCAGERKKGDFSPFCEASFLYESRTSFVRRRRRRRRRRRENSHVLTSHTHTLVRKGKERQQQQRGIVNKCKKNCCQEKRKLERGICYCLDSVAVAVGRVLFVHHHGQV